MATIMGVDIGWTEITILGAIALLIMFGIDLIWQFRFVFAFIGAAYAFFKFQQYRQHRGKKSLLEYLKKETQKATKW